MNTLKNLFAILLPQVMVVLTIYCLFLAFRKTLEVRWKYVLVGIILIAICCVGIGIIAGQDIFGVIYGIYSTLFGCIAALISGVFLLTSLIGKRKLVGVLVIIFIPSLLFSSVFLGDKFSKINTDRAAVIQAIKKYHSENAIYPDSLHDLVPEYIEDLSDPLTTWGWLYLAEADQFSFGYVYGIDKSGYSVCVYSSDISEWDCLPYNTGPFQLGPTPMP